MAVDQVARIVIERVMVVDQVARTVIGKVMVVDQVVRTVQNRVVVMVQDTVRVKVEVVLALVVVEVAVDKLIDIGPFIPYKIKEDHGGKFCFFNTPTQAVGFF